jgi:DUF1680 family protein
MVPENGYVMINREWHSGDSITLVLDMPIERMVPHPAIRHDAGHIALQRGPIVYCLEEVDNGPRLANIAIPNDAALEARFDPNLFGGISLIAGEGVRIEPASWPDEIYQPQSVMEYVRTPFPFKAVPYYLWANRKPGEMRVWIRET